MADLVDEAMLEEMFLSLVPETLPGPHVGVIVKRTMEGLFRSRMWMMDASGMAYASEIFKRQTKGLATGATVLRKVDVETQ